MIDFATDDWSTKKERGNGENTLTADHQRRWLSRLKEFVAGRRRAAITDEALTAGLARKKHLLRALHDDAQLRERHARSPRDSLGLMRICSVAPVSGAVLIINPQSQSAMHSLSRRSAPGSSEPAGSNRGLRRRHNPASRSRRFVSPRLRIDPAARASSNTSRCSRTKLKA